MLNGGAGPLVNEHARYPGWTATFLGIPLREAIESGGDSGSYGEAKTAFLVSILRDSCATLASRSRLSDIELMNRKGGGRTA